MLRFKDLFQFIGVRRSRKQGVVPSALLFPVIWVTNRCNLHCRMCDQWKTPSGSAQEELTTREWFSFVDSASRLHSAVVVVTGGEPLLRKDIFEIIGYMRTKKIAAHLCTNGTLINEAVARKIASCGLNSASISLDSFTDSLHDWMRGTECFRAAVSGIRALRAAAPKIKIGINCVITKKNFLGIEKMIAFAESLGVNQIKFDPVHTNLMHRKKPLESFEGLLFEESDLPQLRTEVEKLIRAAAKSRVLTNSYTFLEGISRLYDTSRRMRLDCYAGYISCAIDPYGWVAPCDNFDGAENLRNKPLEEIWRSESFQRLRAEVLACQAHCWDTTHAELNIRCSRFLSSRELRQIIKELYFYLT
ncbi:MAG: radical SAM protein [Candidatus Omnitrophica bacterium]|nr:radical SAM protein [Candidatus Omnitrophota bacterium]